MTNFSLGFLNTITIASILFCSPVSAWGPDGHRVVGALAIGQLSKPAKRTLLEIMATDELEELAEWCNWPDAYRAKDEGAWSEPLHYINMVPGASLYQRQRDCPDGQCVTEAIGRYAAQLGNSALSMEKRREAYGFVCHFVGDLHQPLHAGFGHDRGGNDFDIRFDGEALNLHHFWDHALIETRSESWSALYQHLSERSGPPPEPAWRKDDVVSWTNESHEFASIHSYPENPEISDDFADQSWERVQDQLTKGGNRLALVLNTVLAKNCGKPAE